MSTPLSSKSPFSWLDLVGLILLQAVSGTRSISSACSSLLEKRLCISQIQLNNLIVAWDTGKFFGWLSSTAANHLPMWMILLIGLIFISISYGMQYMSLVDKIPALSYWQVFLLDVLAGNSICWINTYCNLIAIRNFKNNHRIVTALTASYSTLGGKIYTSLVDGFQERKGAQNSGIYPLLGCLAPTVVGLAGTLLFSCPRLMEFGEIDNFPIAFVIAIATGVYAAFDSVAPPFRHMSPQLRVVILVLVIILPVAVPLVMAVNQFTLEKWRPRVMPMESGVITKSNSKRAVEGFEINADEEKKENKKEGMIVMVGDEHGVKELMMSVNFWLYFWVNACGATLGMVYLNNLGRISESRGNCEASFLLAISSTFGFFGRIFSVMFDMYTSEKPRLSRPASMVLMMIPMSVSFFMLNSASNICLYISTGILGTCLGAITTIIASTTSELFGPHNSVVNNSIVHANIPMGSLLFGYLAALNYEREGGGNCGICMGFNCHHKTFVIWGSICSVGTILSFVLHLRTRSFYSHRS